MCGQRIGEHVRFIELGHPSLRALLGPLRTLAKHRDTSALLASGGTTDHLNPRAQQALYGEGGFPPLKERRATWVIHRVDIV